MGGVSNGGLEIGCGNVAGPATKGAMPEFSVVRVRRYCDGAVPEPLNLQRHFYLGEIPNRPGYHLLLRCDGHPMMVKREFFEEWPAPEPSIPTIPEDWKP